MRIRKEGTKIRMRIRFEINYLIINCWRRVGFDRNIRSSFSFI